MNSSIIKYATLSILRLSVYGMISLGGVGGWFKLTAVTGGGLV